MVSILVPARNEEKNIARYVQSLLALDYPSFEVLVLDDQSSDNTRAILEKISHTHSKLKVLDGDPPPGSQVGKNWACSQLARKAQGELLFFTDADTFHQPETLRTIVTALEGEQADLLTGFPRQEVQTWGERFLVPFFSWALLCFNPLALAYRLRLPALSGALGQMMIFRREAYLKIGGHDGISSSIVDDLMLARKIKSYGLCWRVINITDLISRRMYRNSREAFNGFAKNLFAAFDFRLLPFLFILLWLAVMFWEPLIILMLTIFGQIPHVQAGKSSIRGASQEDEDRLTVIANGTELSYYVNGNLVYKISVENHQKVKVGFIVETLEDVTRVHIHYNWVKLQNIEPFDS